MNISSEVFFQVGSIIITLIGIIITYITVPYVRSKTTIEQRKNIEFWVRIAVNAAEQIFSEPKQGVQKKEYVIAFLEKLGIKVTSEQMDLLIEATVYELNKAKEELLE